MSVFRIVPFAQVKSEFPFLEKSEGFDYFEEWNETDYLLVAEMNVFLDDHLVLDVYEDGNTKALLKFLKVEDYKLFDGTIQGIVILGDLLVNGSILNGIGDYGPFVYIRGNVQCQSLLLGGSYVEIEGNCTVKEVVMADYNHGRLICQGTIKAPIFIVNDHYTTFGGREISHFYYNDKGDDNHPAENDTTEDEEGEYICSSILTTLLDSTLTTSFEELQRDLAAGESVLKNAQKTQRDYAYWEQKIKVNYRDLKRVPSKYKDESICKIALCQTFYALPYCKEEYITQELCNELALKNGLALRVIPHQFITKEICQIAADNGTILNLIPEEYYEEKLILTAIKNRNYEPNIQDVPHKFITKSLLIEYVKIGKGLFLDKVCKENGIDKMEILGAVIDEGIESLDYIFGYHCSKEMIDYAIKRYSNDLNNEALNKYLEKYKTKLSRYN